MLTLRLFAIVSSPALSFPTFVTFFALEAVSPRMLGRYSVSIYGIVPSECYRTTHVHSRMYSDRYITNYIYRSYNPQAKTSETGNELSNL